MNPLPMEPPPPGVRPNAHLLPKLLSHRLRGFGNLEHSHAALLGACTSAVRYLEIDTRVSRDGQVYVHHNPSTGRHVRPGARFAGSNAAELELLRYSDGASLLSLADTLARFRRHAGRDQKLCIDLKDHGFEEVHLQLVRDAGLEERVCFISWIPQSLLRLAELGTRSPLILSHCNLLAWGSLGRPLVSLLRNRVLRFGHYVLIGADRATSDLGAFAHGFQHAVLCRELPEPLLGALRGGGICVHRSLLGRALVDYCRENRLQLWLFSVKTVGDYLRYAEHPGVDVVFSDDAPGILSHLGFGGGQT